MRSHGKRRNGWPPCYGPGGWEFESLRARHEFEGSDENRLERTRRVSALDPHSNGRNTRFPVAASKRRGPSYDRPIRAKGPPQRQAPPARPADRKPSASKTSSQASHGSQGSGTHPSIPDPERIAHKSAPRRRRLRRRSKPPERRVTRVSPARSRRCARRSGPGCRPRARSRSCRRRWSGSRSGGCFR